MRQANQKVCEQSYKYKVEEVILCRQIWTKKQGDRSRLATLYLIHQLSSLSSISVSPRVGRHKLFELLHVGDALDILFLLEPFLDCRSVEVQTVTLADKRNVVASHRSIHRRFRFAEQFANIFHTHQLSFEWLRLLFLANCLFKCFNSFYQILNELWHLLK